MRMQGQLKRDLIIAHARQVATASPYSAAKYLKSVGFSLEAVLYLLDAQLRRKPKFYPFTHYDHTHTHTQEFNHFMQRILTTH